MDTRRLLWIGVAGSALALTIFAGGCTSPSYSPGKANLSGYSRVVVPKFDAGPEVKMPAEKNAVICNAALTRIRESGKFQDVDSESNGKKGELVVQGKMISYEPGNRFERMLPFMGHASFKAEIFLKDGATGKVLDEQTVSSTFAFNGPIGVMTSEDMLVSRIGEAVGRGVSNAKR